jgi:hypothetical protein
MYLQHSPESCQTLAKSLQPPKNSQYSHVAMAIKSLDPRKSNHHQAVSNPALGTKRPPSPKPDPTHSLRFDRMLISTCEWLRTAVCSSDNGPLLISQFSYTPSHRSARRPFSHSLISFPIFPRQENIPTEQSHTPYPNQPVSIFPYTPHQKQTRPGNSRALIARLLQQRPVGVAKNRWSAIKNQSILPTTDGKRTGY